MVAPPTLGPLLLALGAIVSAGSGQDPQPATVVYAMMPMRNLSDQSSAAALAQARIESALKRRGARFVDVEALEARLRERRVRYTDSLSVRDARAVAAALGADYVLAGTVIDYAPGEAPRSALALRAISGSSGARAASAAVALRGVDFEGVLGLGKITDADALLTLAVERLLAAFDEHGRPIAVKNDPRRRRRATPPEAGLGFVRADFDPAQLGRVAILPLTNRSSLPDAPVAWSEFLGDAWFHSSGVEVVEPAEVRAALVRLRVRSMEFLDRSVLAQLGRELETRYFALGGIERFGEELAVDNDRYPEIEATVQVIDAESGRIMAAAGVRRRGDHYQSLLGLGVVRDPLGLAQRAAREIVAGLGG